MLTVAEGILLFIGTTENVLGVLGNAFIGLMTCIDCFRNKKFSVFHIMLTGLVISRIFLIWIISLDAYTKVLFPHVLASGDLTECFSYIWITINPLSVFFATSLNIFYFLKIANFYHSIFLWLKRRTDKVFVFLMGYFLIMWSVTLPLAVNVIKDIKLQQRNTSWQSHPEKTKFFIKCIFANMGPISLFMMALVPCFLLIISLWRHNRQMQLNIAGFRNINKERHAKAMKALISFVALFVLYFIGLFIETLAFFIREKNRLLFILGFTSASMYPCWHSFILILTNSQLKEASVRVLQQLKCSERRKDPRTT